jgi:hypothetical protein
MNRLTSKLLGIVSVAVLGAPAFAYEMPTHFEISAQAAQKSVLSQPDPRADLGLTKALDDTTQIFPSTDGDQDPNFEAECEHGKRLTIQKLIACGAEFEDAPSDRSTNHFFDPAHGGAPLTVLLRDPTGLIDPVVAGKPSPDWVLEDNGEVDGQEFSYRNAREHFYKALTSPLLSDREENWGKLFQTLGQIIHHLQDMAQPQHVRNDAHLDLIERCLRNQA